MKKLEKISFSTIATKLSRAEMKKIMAGSGTSCTHDFDCGITGRCIASVCDNSFGSGTSCYDGNNGGCAIDRICLETSFGTRCI